MGKASMKKGAVSGVGGSPNSFGARAFCSGKGISKAAPTLLKDVRQTRDDEWPDTIGKVCTCTMINGNDYDDNRTVGIMSGNKWFGSSVKYQYESWSV